MMEPVQLLISTGGVLLVLLFVWIATRRSAPLLLGGEAGVRSWLARELLDFRCGQVAVDVDGRRALALSEDGHEIAVVFGMGRGLVAWRLPARELGAIERRTAGGRIDLEIPTGDFTRKSLSFTLAGELPAWIATRATPQGAPA